MTVIEVETKEPIKNKWIRKGEFYYCSDCENEAYWDTDYGQQLFRYCPYCGKIKTNNK